MKKFAMFSAVAIIFLLAVPMMSYAETGEKCAADCVDKCSSLGSGKEYATCLENCLNGCYDKPTGIPEVPPPTPVDTSMEKSDLNSLKSSTEAGTEIMSDVMIIAAASGFDDLDQPCYVGGKVAHYCSRNSPYYNAFSDECYSTLQDCKKADGDLESAPGSGGCVRCGK